MRKLNTLLQFMSLLVLAAGCAPALDAGPLKTMDQNRGEQGESQVPPAPAPGGSTPIATATQKIVLNKSMAFQFLQGSVLEYATTLPIGSQIEVPSNYQQSHLDYRLPDGKLERSSTGFIFPVRILSVPSTAGMSEARREQLNQTAGGLYAPGAMVGTLQGATGNFAALSASTPQASFLGFYQPTGKPKFNYLTAVRKRFGARLNQGVDPAAMSPEKQTKYQAIYQELKKAVDRTTATPRLYLMMDLPTAEYWSKEFEKTGAISPVGAWTIATEATAVRHGFPNVPCAEFQSELVRQAYQRAGYRVTEDFNSTKGNELLWSKTASVVGFSAALYAAGWIPWDTLEYRPIVGSIMMNGAGNTPGHTYISAGDDGRFFVDNGYPQGKDIRASTKTSIEISYQAGVFFLPPGVNPPKW